MGRFPSSFSLFKLVSVSSSLWVGPCSRSKIVLLRLTSLSNISSLPCVICNSQVPLFRLGPGYPPCNMFCPDQERNSPGSVAQKTTSARKPHEREGERERKAMREHAQPERQSCMIHLSCGCVCASWRIRLDGSGALVYLPSLPYPV
jgi:hypothetical protein